MSLCDSRIIPHPTKSARPISSDSDGHRFVNISVHCTAQCFLSETGVSGAHLSRLVACEFLYDLEIVSTHHQAGAKRLTMIVPSAVFDICLLRSTTEPHPWALDVEAMSPFVALVFQLRCLRGQRYAAKDILHRRRRSFNPPTQHPTSESLNLSSVRVQFLNLRLVRCNGKLACTCSG